MTYIGLCLLWEPWGARLTLFLTNEQTTITLNTGYFPEHHIRKIQAIGVPLLIAALS